MAQRWDTDPRYKRARRALLGQPCVYCGHPADTVEHLTPRALGGTNDRDNLAPACRRCNERRGAALGGRLRAARRRKYAERNRSYPVF